MLQPMKRTNSISDGCISIARTLSKRTMASDPVVAAKNNNIFFNSRRRFTKNIVVNKIEDSVTAVVPTPHVPKLFGTLYKAITEYRQQHQLSSLKQKSPPSSLPLQMDQFVSATRCFTSTDVDTYATVVGDSNPLHQQQQQQSCEDGINYNCQQPTKNDTMQRQQPIVHGMLSASMFTSMFGTMLPGAVYLRQKVAFLQPISINEIVTATITITHIRQRKNDVYLTCTTNIYSSISSDSTASDGNVVEMQMLKVRGEAKVWLPDTNIVC